MDTTLPTRIELIVSARCKVGTTPLALIAIYCPSPTVMPLAPDAASYIIVGYLSILTVIRVLDCQPHYSISGD